MRYIIAFAVVVLIADISTWIHKKTAVQVCNAFVGAFFSAEIENGMSYQCDYSQDKLHLYIGESGFMLDNGQFVKIEENN